MEGYDKTVEKAKEYIIKHIGLGVSPDDTAKAMNYSLRQLNRIFSLNIVKHEGSVSFYKRFIFNYYFLHFKK